MACVGSDLCKALRNGARAALVMIHYELGVAVRSPEMQAIFETIGAEPMTNSSKEFLIHNTNEIAKLVKVVKAAKIQVN